jgi:hypothetical protein
VLKLVGGPWPDEPTARREAVKQWVSIGSVYFETAPNVIEPIN